MAANIIRSEYNELPISEVRIRGGLGSCDCYALWDTGSSRTTIDPDIVEGLRLKPLNLAISHSADGSSVHRTYEVDVLLPGGIIVDQIEVAGMDRVSTVFKVIIGMDIIGDGDFVMTRHDGSLHFSFSLQKCGLSLFDK